MAQYPSPAYGNNDRYRQAPRHIAVRDADAMPKKPKPVSSFMIDPKYLAEAQTPPDRPRADIFVPPLVALHEAHERFARQFSSQNPSHEWLGRAGTALKNAALAVGAALLAVRSFAAARSQIAANWLQEHNPLQQSPLYTADKGLQPGHRMPIRAAYAIPAFLVVAMAALIALTPDRTVKDPQITNPPAGQQQTEDQNKDNQNGANGQPATPSSTQPSQSPPTAAGSTGQGTAPRTSSGATSQPAGGGNTATGSPSGSAAPPTETATTPTSPSPAAGGMGGGDDGSGVPLIDRLEDLVSNPTGLPGMTSGK